MLLFFYKFLSGSIVPLFQNAQKISQLYILYEFPEHQAPKYMIAQSAKESIFSL
jgi:hypothetical protein